MEWKNFFDNHILERGYIYYMNGEVHDVEASDEDITGIVSGSSDYEVTILLHKGQIKEMFCDCPFALRGNACKHMAAVLYAYDDGAYQVKKISVTPKKDMTIEETVKQADEKTVKDFLISLFERDPSLYELFKHTQDISIENTHIMNEELDDIVKRYVDDNGYIDYKELDDFYFAIEEKIEEVKTLLPHQFMKAFYLVVDIYQILNDAHVEKSLDTLYQRLYELWKECILAANYASLDEMYEYFTMKLKNGYDHNDMESSMIDLLLECFTEERFLKNTKSILEEKIQSYKGSFRERIYLLAYLKCLEKLKAPYEEIRSKAKTYWSAPAIRRFYIDYCKRHLLYEEAITVVKESIKMNGFSQTLREEYFHILLELYQLTDKMPEYQSLLEAIVTKRLPGNLEFYHEYKKLYTATRWERVRDSLLLKLPVNADTAKLFLEENRYDLLIDYVMNSDLNALYTYQKVLKDRYPELILQKYEEELNKAAKQANSRKDYYELVRMMEPLSKIKGGSDVIHKLINNWKTIYPRRKAMLEELSKAEKKWNNI